MSRKIVVVGIDGSESSRSALQEAAHYAELLGADLRCVTTWAHVPYEDIQGTYDPEQTAKDLVLASVQEVFKGGIPAWVTTVTTLGPAGPALVAEGAHATLLVVGTRGHSAIGGMLVGSVSTHCAEHALCPVLIVRANADRELVDATALHTESA